MNKYNLNSMDELTILNLFRWAVDEIGFCDFLQAITAFIESGFSDPDFDYFYNLYQDGRTTDELIKWEKRWESLMVLDRDELEKII